MLHSARRRDAISSARQLRPGPQSYNNNTQHTINSKRTYNDWTQTVKGEEGKAAVTPLIPFPSACAPPLLANNNSSRTHTTQPPPASPNTRSVLHHHTRTPMRQSTEFSVHILMCARVAMMVSHTTVYVGGDERHQQDQRGVCVAYVAVSCRQ